VQSWAFWTGQGHSVPPVGRAQVWPFQRSQVADSMLGDGGYASKKQKPLAGLLDGNSEGEGLGG
jgi:hypothetical protein